MCSNCRIDLWCLRATRRMTVRSVCEDASVVPVAFYVDVVDLRIASQIRQVVADVRGSV